jgi:hypothetical protein
MSGTTAKWTTPASLTLIASAGDLASGTGWANSSATLLDNSTDRYLYMDVELVLAAARTAGAGTPRVDVYLVPALDGTNVANPPGTTPGLTPGHYFRGSILANPSASFTRGALSGIVLQPIKYLIAINNQLGVTFSTGTHVLTGYRYGEIGE